MDLAVSRKMLRTLEPYHGMIYFVPEAREEYERAGLQGQRMGYFASRAAAMGPVPVDVVIATLFNFHPALVRKAIPAAWDLATPARVLDARLAAVDRRLRRMLGDDAINSPEMAEAAALASLAAAGCHPEGRPLYAAHAALPVPDLPHLALWHAQTLLREFRGDGHLAAMVTAGVTGPEALVIHEASGAEGLAGVLQTSRAWPDDEWEATKEGLRRRGWLADDGTLTEAGAASRQRVEDTTDRLALVCWEPLGEERC